MNYNHDYSFNKTSVEDNYIEERQTFTAIMDLISQELLIPV